MRYALINPLDGTIAQISELTELPQQHNTRWKWLPILPDPVAFDPETEISLGTTIQIFPDHVQETIQKRSMTAEEIDALKNSRIDKLDLIALQVAFNHENRLRALASPPNPQLTMAQFKAAIKSLL